MYSNQIGFSCPTTPLAPQQQLPGNIVVQGAMGGFKWAVLGPGRGYDIRSIDNTVPQQAARKHKRMELPTRVSHIPTTGHNIGAEDGKALQKASNQWVYWNDTQGN